MCVLAALCFPRPLISSGPGPPVLPYSLLSITNVYQEPARHQAPEKQQSVRSRTHQSGETDAPNGNHTQESEMAEMQWARQEQRAPGPAHGSWSSRGEWTGSGHRRRDRKWEQFSTKNRGEQRGGGRAKTGDALEGFNGKKPRLCLLGLEESAVSHLHFSINLSWRVAFCRLIFILHLVSDCGVKAQCSLEGFQTPQIDLSS